MVKLMGDPCACSTPILALAVAAAAPATPVPAARAPALEGDALPDTDSADDPYLARSPGLAVFLGSDLPSLAAVAAPAAAPRPATRPPFLAPAPDAEKAILDDGASESVGEGVAKHAISAVCGDGVCGIVNGWRSDGHWRWDA